MVRFFVAVANKSLFDQLSALLRALRSNFFRTSGTTQFWARQPGGLFLFELHAPDNFIVGGGMFIILHRAVVPGLGRLWPGERRIPSY